MLLNLPYSLPSFILKYQLKDEIVPTLKYNSKAYISCRKSLHVLQIKKKRHTQQHEDEDGQNKKGQTLDKSKEKI